LPFSAAFPAAALPQVAGSLHLHVVSACVLPRPAFVYCLLDTALCLLGFHRCIFFARSALFACLHLTCVFLLAAFSLCVPLRFAPRLVSLPLTHNVLPFRRRLLAFTSAAAVLVFCLSAALHF
jgi:hypothetical protein